LSREILTITATDHCTPVVRKVTWIKFILVPQYTMPQSAPGLHVNQFIGLFSIVVHDYDEAITFYVGTLGFRLIEDTYIPEQDKRWVVVAPPGNGSTQILLARAVNEEQASRVGNQAGGRVSFFLYTDDFWRDYHLYKAKSIVFVREPKEERYGTVAVFRDLYGNLWDLLEPKA
jgi:catechol 2,3-dioxygenase-like lactoylglutathione lyase family enzyme